MNVTISFEFATVLALLVPSIIMILYVLYLATVDALDRAKKSPEVWYIYRILIVGYCALTIIICTIAARGLVKIFNGQY